MRELAPAVREVEPRLARGRAQLEKARLLPARDVDGVVVIGDDGVEVATFPERDHATDAVQLRLVEALVERFDQSLRLVEEPVGVPDLPGTAQDLGFQQQGLRYPQIGALLLQL